ncbi:hypothetical protein [Thermoactinomyces mirandus]|uniref:Uncharacterized protein n=1 Tax=Thermoactinomyces mirandus TaxID=2756294 RepID=A0A7W2AQA5_9BACL|nr:hypothetical protein [Thermoactinomyces mirandus]MBA4601102.1 hypothetical protein [Thermoactinomyces mirandus]
MIIYKTFASSAIAGRSMLASIIGIRYREIMINRTDIINMEFYVINSAGGNLSQLILSSFSGKRRPEFCRAL